MIEESEGRMVIAFKQLFQMNYQQHRNPPSLHPHPQHYGTPYHILDPPTNSYQPPLPHLERQTSRTALLKLPFHPNGYTETKEYFRPQQTVITAPLTFNMQSPTKLKAKKTNRQLANKSYATPFTQELQREFLKNHPNPSSPLEDFSKTTSSINGSSILNLQQTLTEPNDERIFTPLKLHSDPQPITKITHSNSHKILFERNSPYTANLFTHSNSTYLQKPPEPTSGSKQRENGYLFDQKFLLDEVKGLKELNEKYEKEIVRLNGEVKGGFQKQELRGSRKENKFQSKQLELKSQQNNKLLAQIEEMEKDLKGKVELNRYLEQQCNSYSDKYEQVKRQFDIFKTKQSQQISRQEQTITTLRRHQNELQSQSNKLKIINNSKDSQNIQLKKALQLQGQKLRELSTNNDIQKSQINVLNKRLQNFQAKYEKLMQSHYQTQSRLINYQENLQQAITQKQQRQELYTRDIHGLQSKLNSLIEEKGLLALQISGLRGEIAHMENRGSELKMFYEEQYGIVRQELTETNKIVESKTQENQHLRSKIQARIKENQELQSKLRDALPTVELLRIKTAEKVSLEGLLEQKSNELQVLKARHKLVEQDCIKISCQIEQRNTIIAWQASQINEIRTKTALIQSQHTQLNARYDSLRTLFESQSLHIQQLQTTILQHQSRYNILQRESAEFSTKAVVLQKDYDDLKQLYQALQSFHQQTIHTFTNEIDGLQRKNRELTDIIHIKQAQMIDLQSARDQFQKQLQKTQQNATKLNEMIFVCSQYEQQLTTQSQQAQQSKKQMQELQQKYSLIQSNYLQALQQTQSASQALQAELSQSCKSQVETWDLLSKKELQVQSLRHKIQILEEKVQSQTDQLHAIEQVKSKQESFRMEIEELMLIIEQNQRRSEEEKDRLGRIIDELKVQVKSLQQQLTEEGLEYNTIILQLKSSIEALQTQSPNKPSMKTSILQDNQSIQLKQWNSLNEFQSFDSMEEAHSRKIESAEELVQETGDIAYIEMDRQGVNYLCQLLQIDAQGGNILSQIVVRIENAINQVELSRKTSQSYRSVLEAFGVQQGVGSYSKLMAEITNFKQNLSLVIDQLKEQQLGGQALRGQCLQWQMMHQGELMKGQRLIQELHCLGHLNHDLNETILVLNARLTNQRFKMTEAMALAKLSLREVRFPSEKFVTANSIAEGMESEGVLVEDGDIE